MAIDLPNLQHYWYQFTRLGEIQILLPAALLTIGVLSTRAESKPLALKWLGALVLAVLVTTASKIAFIGWGIGIPALNFTGISGHAMIASAVYPLLMATLASRWPPNGQKFAVGAGMMLALMVGVSRLEVGAHSVSEVLAGLLVGGVVSLTTFAKKSLPRAVVGSVFTVLVGGWLLVSPLHAPLLETHAWVTRLSLRLSGNTVPATRDDLLPGIYGR